MKTEEMKMAFDAVFLVDCVATHAKDGPVDLLHSLRSDCSHDPITRRHIRALRDLLTEALNDGAER